MKVNLLQSGSRFPIPKKILSPPTQYKKNLHEEEDKISRDYPEKKPNFKKAWLNFKIRMTWSHLKTYIPFADKLTYLEMKNLFPPNMYSAHTAPYAFKDFFPNARKQ